MTESEEGLNDQGQFQYRSAVGMLLVLVNCSRPDIDNAVIEFLQVNDKANQAHYKHMLRTVKYVIQKDLKWTFKCLCDSDYTGDKDTRLSVTGYCVYVNKYLISWKSRAQRCNTLSSTEAEYVALSEVASTGIFRRRNQLSNNGLL